MAKQLDYFLVDFLVDFGVSYWFLFSLAIFYWDLRSNEWSMKLRSA